MKKFIFHIKKYWRFIVFYGWQGDLSENETGLSDGIFVFRGL